MKKKLKSQRMGISKETQKEQVEEGRNSGKQKKKERGVMGTGI